MRRSGETSSKEFQAEIEHLQSSVGLISREEHMERVRKVGGGKLL